MSMNNHATAVASPIESWQPPPQPTRPRHLRLVCTEPDPPACRSPDRAAYPVGGGGAGGASCGDDAGGFRVSPVWAGVALTEPGLAPEWRQGFGAAQPAGHRFDRGGCRGGCPQRTRAVAPAPAPAVAGGGACWCCRGGQPAGLPDDPQAARMTRSLRATGQPAGYCAVMRIRSRNP